VNRQIRQVLEAASEGRTTPAPLGPSRYPGRTEGEIEPGRGCA
jgi:hypothetical protein